MASVLLLRGDLNLGSHLIAGTVSARVRSIADHTGQTLKVAYPGTAITISGWKELPKAGDEVLQGKNEDEIKKAIANRIRRAESESVLEDVDAINAKRRLERERREAHLEGIKNGTIDPKAITPIRKPDVSLTEPTATKVLNLIIKSDVMGSAEAVAGALEGIGNEKVKTKVISSSAGEPTEGDITMAQAINGTHL